MHQIVNSVPPLANHGAGSSPNLWILGGIILLIGVLLALIGVAQHRDPQRAERMELRRALVSTPTRRRVASTSDPAHARVEATTEKGMSATDQPDGKDSET